MKRWSPEERETTINATDADDVIMIWTAQTPYIRRLRKHPDVTEVASGDDEHGNVWAQFTIPADRWDPVKGIKRRMSDRERELRAGTLLGGPKPPPTAGPAATLGGV